VPSIPVDPDYYSIAYIKEGSLTLSTEESGGTVYYTLDGTDPATTVGGSTYEYTTPITLSTTESYQQITVKAITVVNAGTANAEASDVKTFTYRIVPGGLTINSIRHGYNGSYTFNSTDSYADNSYALRAGVPGESNAGYAITAIDYAIKLDDGNDTWIALGSVSGTAYSLAYTKTVNWSYSQTPFSGNAILRATASDVAGNTSIYEIPIKIVMSSPTAPANLTAASVEGGVRLDWDASTYVEGYGYYYLIYRGTALDQLNDLLGYVYYTNNKTFTDVISDPTGTTYYYGVKADTYYYGGGRSSGFSNIVSAVAAADTTQPVIYYVDIPAGIIRSSSTIYISASDNSGLKEIKAEVSLKDQNNWQQAGILTGTGLTYYSFDLSGLPALTDGQYELKVTVTDYYNNTAAQTVSFTLDNTAPAAPLLQATARPGGIKLSFNKSDEDISKYYLYYKLHDAAEFSSSIVLYDNDENLNDIINYFHNLSNNIGKTYDYKISALDVADNESIYSEVVSATVAGYSPTLIIVPDTARPGEVLNITVDGFLGQESVYFFLDEATGYNYEAYLYTDQDGQATLAWNIPNGLTGAHRFRFEGQASGAKVMKTYTITDYTPVVTAPATARAGDSIAVSVEQFGWLSAYYSKTIKICFNGIEKTSIYAYNNTSSGYAAAGSTTMQIPYTAAGTMEIRAESGDGYTAVTSIAVTPSAAALTVTPAGQRSGDMVSLSVSGFAPGEYVYFYKAGQYLSYVTADQNGSASFNYRLAANDTGDIFFEAQGSTSSLSRGMTYTSQPARLTMTGPASVYAGSSADFSVAGFNQNEFVEFFVNGASVGSTWAYAGYMASRSITLNETGNVLITATCATSGMTVSIYCNVKNPDSLAPVLVAIASAYTGGSVVTLNADGFKAGEQIKFYSNTALIGTYPADAGGGYSLVYTIPAETPAGTQFVFAASGQTSGLTAAATVAGVTGELDASYSGSPKPGDVLNVTITGAYDASNCKFIWMEN
jgi:hypothetical protein